MQALQCCTLTLILLSVGMLAKAQHSLPVEAYSKIELNLSQQENLLMSLAADGLAVDHFMKTGPNSIELILSESELQVLESRNIQYDLLVSDMAAYYERMLQTPANREMAGCGLQHFDDGAMGGYHTYDEVVAHLTAMATEFGEIVNLTEIGASIEGRPILAVKISDNVETDESAEEGVVYFDALHHAREPISMESALFYMWWLLENYGNDAEATYLVDHREMYFVPVVNPDGYVYNQQTNPNGGGLWRKNRRDAGNSCFGIDLNRNYSFGWGMDSGSSNDPCTQTYRGTEPFSEPETRAIRDLLSGINPAIAFSCHTYGDKFLSPFGYTDSLATYEVYAEFASEFIPPTYAGYGTTAKMLGYVSSGTTRDFLHVEGAYAWTPEIGHSFWEPASVICERVQEFMPTMKYLTWVSGNFVRFQNFELLNDQIWQGDTIRLNVRLKNRGLAFPSTDVIVSLESLDERIIPIRNSISYGNIAPRAYMDNGSDPFSFVVEGELEVGELLPFELSATQDGQESYRGQIVLAAGRRTVLYSDDFESGGEDWLPGTPISWDTTFMDSRSGFHSLADSRYGNYPPNANSSVLFGQNIDLSNANHPQLEFDAKWSMEEDYDYVVLQADAGNGFEPLEGLFSTFSGGQPRYIYNQHWVQEYINLNNYIGSPAVSFRLLLRADGGVHSDGFYLDDFKVVDYSEPLMSSSREVNVEAVNLAVLPNPNRGRFDLSVTTPRPTPAQLEVYTASGKLVQEQHLELVKEHNQFPCNLEGYPPGVYWLRLKTDFGVLAIPMVLF
ncbi:MAG: T9SS type A sorting domain-containing protein [Lewinellaceae bacterium]|nr:T9SS type A sorting domain-containing protein [Lewinellaceae bacterium]